jgi:hypothetical protein
MKRVAVPSGCAAMMNTGDEQVQLPRNGAVSMGQRNTCSTRLLAGVLRVKVGREGCFKKTLLCIGLIEYSQTDRRSGVKYCPIN